MLADERVTKAAAFRARQELPGLDPKFAAAVRRIDELGGELAIRPRRPAGRASISAGDRVSAADADVHHLLALPHLKELKLSGGGVTDEGFAGSVSIAGLVSLSLLDAQLSDAGLGNSPGCRNLSSLMHPAQPAVDRQGAGASRAVAEAHSAWAFWRSASRDRGLEQLAGLHAASRCSISAAAPRWAIPA